MNGTLQDRLVKELRLCGVSDVASANAVLDHSFLKQFKGEFSVPAAKRTDLHRKVGAASKLDEVPCEREHRAVGRDWCVQWRGRWLQVEAKHAGLDLCRPGRRMTVIQNAGGTVLIRYAGRALTWLGVSKRPQRIKAKKKKPVTQKQASCAGPGSPVQPPAGVPGRATPAPRLVGYASEALSRGP